MTDYKRNGDKQPVDELDIIEAYGGEGPHEPNAFDTYMITPHCWNGGELGKTIEKTGVRRDAQSDSHAQVRHPLHLVRDVSYLRLQNHRHRHDLLLRQYRGGPPPDVSLSKQKPFFFLINLATGGGWPVDLSRYNGLADMYVDYVRVYQEKK